MANDLKYMVIHIINSPEGGGAEVLVRNLNLINDRLIGNKGRAVYFTNPTTTSLNEFEHCLGCDGPRSPASIFKLRSYIKQCLRENPDYEIVVHSHLTWPFYFTVLALAFLKCHRIYTEHNTSNRRRRYAIFRFVDRLFYGRYKRVICISAGVERSLAEWSGDWIKERLRQIDNGAPLYPLHQREALGSTRKPKLVSVGSLTEKKGFAGILPAVAELRDDIHSYTIVGDGPCRGELEALIARFSLHDKVVLAGWSNSTEQFYRAADIQLIPSLWEGFGLVAVEGMSTGLPVVASDVDGLREVLGKTNPAVILVEGFRAKDAWVEAVRRMICRVENDQKSIAIEARRQAERFDLTTMTRAYNSVYREVLRVGTK